MTPGRYIPSRMKPSERSIPVRGQLLDRLRRALDRFGRSELAVRLGMSEEKLERIWKLRVVYVSTHEVLLQKLPR